MSTSYDRRREIGAIGTGLRLVVALILIVVPVARAGLAPWDLFGALVVLPLLAIGLDRLLRSGIERVGTPALQPRSSGVAAIWYLNIAVLVLFLALAVGLSYVTPIDGGAIWLFFGFSMLLGAARGDAGCEVLALKNALARRRDPSGCIVFAPLDAVEARRNRQAVTRTE
jgi:hypothetical protein